MRALAPRFGARALWPATWLAPAAFRDEPARALFAGCAAHSILPLSHPMTSALGVLFALNMQISFLSPPFGPAAFYLKSVAPPDISLGTIFRSLLPFIALQAVALVLVLLFPSLALWYR